MTKGTSLGFLLMLLTAVAAAPAVAAITYSTLDHPLAGTQGAPQFVEDYEHMALRLKASRYVRKGAPLEDLRTAVRELAADAA